MAGTTGLVKGGECERRVRDKSGVWERKKFERPPMIELYNELMGGVDQGDRLRGFLCSEGQQVFHKWYKKLFFAVRHHQN